MTGGRDHVPSAVELAAFDVLWATLQAGDGNTAPSDGVLLHGAASGVVTQLPSPP